ncbi:probable NAD(P)H dehydrogenase subunit CRR3, chloroplastic [Lolium rigidum]|uniref:probable NAD(P)H dehydrogenase subunit CRR3, chloroplastic n=1 Tax=Lolium rigidum TaxID=89674 RepID=UPI001F5C1C00|nr:probable NAD(P)H dehydrogenase subunit CRR3, chloroplastic [Lolium rigidum]
MVMAWHLAAACAPRLAVVASSASGDPVRRIRRRVRGSPPRKTPTPAPTQPSVAEVRRAIGADNDPSASGKDKQSGFMKILASTPIGQPESDAERRIREAAEWVVDNTEARAQQGQKSVLVLCMKIFPLWFFLMLIALGVIKLPFDIPGLDMENLLM